MSALRAEQSSRRVRRPRKVTPARWVAWQAIRRTFDEDAWTDRVFAAEARRLELDGRDRAFSQHLAYGTVQQARKLDYVIGVVGRRPLRKIDAPVLHALRLGTFELLNGQGGGSDHAAVDQAVELVRGVCGERATAFTNAVLRRAQVDAGSLLAQLDPAQVEDLSTLLSFPEWMVRRMGESFGDDGVAALAAQNVGSGQAALRVSGAGGAGGAGGAAGPAGPAGAVADLVRQAGAQLATVPQPFQDALPEALVVEGSTASLGALIEQGAVHPQSLASMLVGRAVAPQPGDHVVDTCAAPGGKSTHLATLTGPGGRVLACELHEHRADSIRVLARRLGVADRVQVRVGDATTLRPSDLQHAWGDRPGALHPSRADAVLVDAPCSGLGVLARRPDARWKRREDELEGLVDLQRRLLVAACDLLRPGGVLVYSTCSLLLEENEQVAQWALDALPLRADSLEPHVPAALLLPGIPHMARTWPQRDATDGFFIARFVREPGEAASA